MKTNLKKKSNDSKCGNLLSASRLLIKDENNVQNIIVEKKEEHSPIPTKKIEHQTHQVLNPLATRPTKVKGLSIKIPEKNKELENRMKVRKRKKRIFKMKIKKNKICKNMK